jgi:hypothetical protein
MQYEDEMNRFALAGFVTVHFSVLRRLTDNFSVLASMENALGREYLTGRTPLPAIGPPRLWRAGLRWDGGL